MCYFLGSIFCTEYVACSELILEEHQEYLVLKNTCRNNVCLLRNIYSNKGHVQGMYCKKLIH